MIPVVKPAAPDIWAARAEVATRELCEAYQLGPGDYKSGKKTFDFKASIYSDPIVKAALRDSQHRKCAFCESVYDHVGYGDVEHFRPKAGYRQRKKDDLKRPGYYWLAYQWDNLYHSCQLCNQRFKRNLFPLMDNRSRARAHTHRLNKERPLLIDPGKQDPADYVGFREEYAYAIGGCAEGTATIEILGLNREELVEVRRDRLSMLKILLLAIELLKKAVATAPAAELANQLQVLQDQLEARRSPAGEYCAMVRAFA
jgi:uncharacterized protein (TIGR02646 family)